MDSIRERAVALRKEGLTYTEIQHALGQKLPKSTLSYWFKSIKLTGKQADRIADIAAQKLNIARQAALRANKKALRERISSSEIRARNFVGEVSQREAKLALAMLYLGEGGKYPGTRGLYLGSSDPRIVNLYIQLLILCYGIERKDLKCSVYHRADQNVDELQKYWSNVTGIPLVNFYPSRPDSRTVNKPTRNKAYKGVAHIYHKGVDKQLELDHIANALLEALVS